MKIISKVLVLVLSAIMVLAMSASVFAVSGTNATKGHLSVANAEDGQTYTAYKMLDLLSYDTDKDAYSYKVADGWVDFFTGTGAGAAYFTLDLNNQIKANTLADASDSDVAEFAKAALQYAKDNDITGITITSEETEVDLGYYVVGTTLGSLCALDTTNPDVEIYEKNSKPSVSKTVKDSDDADTAYGESATADVGEVVNFKLVVNTGTNEKGVNAGINSNYVITDVMTNLTYVDGSVEISGGLESWTLDTDYTVSWDSGSKTLTINLLADSIKNLGKNVDITVKYDATVDTTAVSNDSTANKNEVTLTYNNETSTDVTYVKTYKFSVLKNDGETALSGAKFKLSTTTDETDALPLATIDTNQYQYQTGTGEATEITTDDTGAFSIEGLDAGTYYLIETDAPTGYNKLNAPITVTIAEDGSVTFTAGNESDTATGNDITVTVVNQTGAELPSTGGIGTTIFYILGSALVIGCGIVLISRKRMNSK